MHPDAAALLTLAIYAAAAIVIVAVQVVRSGIGFPAWFLYVVNQAYVGLFLHWRANRRCPFPQHGPALILANHTCPVDPLILWMNLRFGPNGAGPIRVISFLMAREYYEMRGLSWVCRAMRSIPASRNGRDIGPAKEALSKLKNGDLVGVFPEGRLNKGTGLLPFDEGAAWLALRANVPVYPVFLHNTPRGKNMVEPFYTPTRVRVAYGDAIDLSPWSGDRSREALKAVTELFAERLSELGGLPRSAASRSAEEQDGG